MTIPRISIGGGLREDLTFRLSYESLGFIDHEFSFDPSNPQEFNNAIASIINYLFTVIDSTIVINVGKGTHFLALDILGFYRDKDFKASTYSRPLPLNLVWGKEVTRRTWDHLNPADYDQADKKFREKGFTLNDLRLFTAFSNIEGGDKNGLIMRYIWNIIKQTLMRRLDGVYLNEEFSIFDLTRHSLN